MKTVIYHNEPVVADLISAIHDFETGYESFDNAVADLKRNTKIDGTQLISYIEANVGNRDVLAHITATRREDVLTYEAQRLCGAYLFRQLQKQRQTLFLAIRRAYAFLETPGCNSEVVNNVVAADVSIAIELYKREKPEKFWPVHGVAKFDPGGETITVLTHAFNVLLANQPAAASIKATGDNGLSCYPIEHVELLGLPAKASNNFERRKLFFVPLPLDDSNTYIKLSQIPAAVKALQEALLTLRQDVRKVDYGSIAECRYASTLLSFARGDHYDQGQELTVIDGHKQDYIRHERQLSRLALQINLVAALRIELAILLREVIAEFTNCFNQGGTAVFQLQRISDAKTPICKSAIINCLFVDTVLRIAGRELKEAVELLENDVTSGRSKSALKEFLQDQRSKFVLAEISEFRESSFLDAR